VNFKFREPIEREKRPDWNLVPQAIVLKIENYLQDKIINGEITWGGFSNSAAFKIDLESGRKFFIKGSHPDQDSHGIKNLNQEIEIYRSISNIENISPEYIGYINDGDEDGWALAIFEYIDKVPIAPWTEDKIISVFSTLRKIHNVKKTALDKNFPIARNKNYIERFFKPEGGWLRIREEKKIFNKFISIFEDRVKAQKWLGEILNIFCEYQLRVNDIGGHEGIIHQDLRSDNILFSKNDDIYLIDWANACYGPIVMDIAWFLPSISSESKFSFSELLFLYEEATSIKLRKIDVILAMVSISGYLADNIYRNVPDKLPRLRWMQKRIFWEILKEVSLLLDMNLSLPSIKK